MPWLSYWFDYDSYICLPYMCQQQHYSTRRIYICMFYLRLSSSVQKVDTRWPFYKHIHCSPKDTLHVDLEQTGSSYCISCIMAIHRVHGMISPRRTIVIIYFSYIIWGEIPILLQGVYLHSHTFSLNMLYI